MELQNKCYVPFEMCEAKRWTRMNRLVWETGVGFWGSRHNSAAEQI